MSRSVGLAHIIRQHDGTSVGVWGLFTLKSAFQPIFAFDHGKVAGLGTDAILLDATEATPRWLTGAAASGAVGDSGAGSLRRASTTALTMAARSRTEATSKARR